MADSGDLTVPHVSPPCESAAVTNTVSMPFTVASETVVYVPPRTVNGSEPEEDWYISHTSSQSTDCRWDTAKKYPIPKAVAGRKPVKKGRDATGKKTRMRRKTKPKQVVDLETAKTFLALVPDTTAGMNTDLAMIQSFLTLINNPKEFLHQHFFVSEEEKRKTATPHPEDAEPCMGAEAKRPR